MWIAKSTDEIRAEANASRRRAMVIALSAWVALLYLILVSPLWHGQHLAALVLPLAGFIFPIVANTVALALALAAMYCLHGLRRKQETTLICPKCNRLKTLDAHLECVCGGRFLPLREMKWVEQNQQKAPTDKRSGAAMGLLAVRE